MVSGWARYTPEEFVFAAKVPQPVTHDRLLALGKGADRDLRAYCELMRPLLDAGNLGPLLLQLPPRLRFQEAAIHRFLDVLPRDFSFALEPRNKTWMTMEAFDLLRATGVAYPLVDEPLLPPDLHVTSAMAYLRWHGHGTDPWYNYRYGEDELKSWVPRVQQVASQAETVYGFFNNHFHGYAPENCLQILRMLGVQTQEHTRALRRIDGFRKVATPAEGRLRSLTLEDFGADVPKDALIQPALERVMDRNRPVARVRVRFAAKRITRHSDVSGAMGVLLTPIVVRHPTTLNALRGRTIAVDGNLELYQFLSVMRTRDGRPLEDSKGRITSHLNGLAFRTTRLIADYDIRPVFVFDGPPPDLKRQEIQKRREAREQSQREYEAAIAAGDTATAWSKAVMKSRLTRPMVEEAKTLLTLLGIPWVQAPSEGEAEAAFLARQGRVWAAGSKDYDSLLFGAPRLVRFPPVREGSDVTTRPPDGAGVLRCLSDERDFSPNRVEAVLDRMRASRRPLRRLEEFD